MVLVGKPSQEHPVNAGDFQSSILGPTLFVLYINDLPDNVICDVAIYADDTTVFFKCDMWQQLELASGKRWLVDFDAGKLNWFHVISLITLVLLM